MINRAGIIYRLLHSINVMRIKTLNIFYKKSLYRWFDRSDYPAKLFRFKNIHKGERCFIIGNGPSLLSSDLDLIKDEVTFSCNKIYRMFEQTEWRPYYYVVDDATFVRTDSINIKTIPAKAKFVGVEFNKRFANLYKNTDVIIFKKKTELVDLKPKWSEEVSDYIGSGHSVTFPMFQLAVYMGFSEIYFLGQDCSFLASMGDDSIQNHFYKNDDYIINENDANNVIYAFYAIKEYAERCGVKVYNATRGGKLELFNRVNLDDIM